MDRCALYLVRDHHSGAVKIGISKQPETRIRQFAGHYAVGKVSIIKTTWFATREAAHSWESHFHRRYRFHHSPEQGGREWFDLTDAQIQDFVEWMDASTNQRTIKVVTVKAEAEKSKQELSAEQWTTFWQMSVCGLISLIVPVIGYVVTGFHPIGILLAPAGVGAFWACRVEKIKKLSRTYQLDGQPLGSSFLKSEYETMGLWEERTLTLSGIKSSDWEFPDSTTANHAERLFGLGK